MRFGLKRGAGGPGHVLCPHPLTQKVAPRHPTLVSPSGPLLHPQLRDSLQRGRETGSQRTEVEVESVTFSGPAGFLGGPAVRAPSVWPGRDREDRHVALSS